MVLPGTHRKTFILIAAFKTVVTATGKAVAHVLFTREWDRSDFDTPRPAPLRSGG